MNGWIRAGVAMALLSVAACSNSANDANSVDLNTPPGGTAGAGTGLVTDQTSIAYFQQAIGDRVLFAVDQSTLSDAAQAVLTAQADWMVANPSYSVVIEGHADEQGTREYNLALGARRATAAQEFLISRGVSADRLRVVSFGKERPIEICSEETCYAKNRRAVTVLSSDLTG